MTRRSRAGAASSLAVTVISPSYRPAGVSFGTNTSTHTAWLAWPSTALSAAGSSNAASKGAASGRQASPCQATGRTALSSDPAGRASAFGCAGLFTYQTRNACAFGVAAIFVPPGPARSPIRTFTSESRSRFFSTIN